MTSKSKGGNIMCNKRILIALSVLASVAVAVSAGELDSPGPPDTTFSYTLEDIYDRLDSGAAGTQITFTEPVSGPVTGTMHTLNDIMSVAPQVDDTNGAAASQVMSGMTYWSLQSGAWGLKTGTYECLPCDCTGGTLYGTRWCDNGDGTVTDLLGDSTNNNIGRCLVWMKDANCSANLAGVNKTDRLTWDNANIWSSVVSNGNCSLTDGSTEYEWRQPTRAELDGITNGTDPINDSNKYAFINVHSQILGYCYWSSNTRSSDTAYAMSVDIYDSSVVYSYKTTASGQFVWPVRGQR